MNRLTHAFAGLRLPSSEGLSAPVSQRPAKSTWLDAMDFAAQYLVVDEVCSSENSDSSVLSSPQLSPSTPATVLSPPSSPRVFEVGECDAHKDETMADSGNDLQEPSALDEDMNDCAESIPAASSQDDDTVMAVEQSATEDDSAMDGVESTSPPPSPATTQPATPVVVAYAPTFTPSPSPAPSPSTTSSLAYSPAFKRIWKRLKDYGPSLLGDLRDEKGEVLESVLNIEPTLHSEVLRHIRGVRDSQGLMNLLELRFNGGLVSVPQLRALWRCVLHTRDNTIVPVVRENKAWPSDRYQALLLKVPAETPVATAPPSESSTSTQVVDDGVQLDLNTQCMVGLLQRAHGHLLNQTWAAKIADMFDLPWHNKVVMEKLAKYVVKHPKWGSGDFDTAKTRIEDLCSSGVSDVPTLMWTCCMFVQVQSLEPEPVGSKGRCNYESHRKRVVRCVYDAIANSNYDNIALGLTGTCMTWQEIRGLAKSEEYEFLRTRMGTTKPRAQRDYDKYMPGRIAHWKDRNSVRLHIEAQNPVVLPPANVPALPKRSKEPVEVLEAKRARQTEDTVEEQEDVKRCHKRKEQGGKS